MTLQTRRGALGLTGGSLALLAAGRALAAEPTPNMTIGPMYPIARPLDEDGDLTVINGNKTGARGRILHVFGRVLTQAGVPVAGARIELWQANAAGRYAHPADTTTTPRDAGFQGFGTLATDAEGRYRFKTVKPGAYFTPAGGSRTPHLHFDVRGRNTRIVTQMFFPGEAMNADDVLLKAESRPDALMSRYVAAPTGEPEALACVWDIVLQTG